MSKFCNCVCSLTVSVPIFRVFFWLVAETFCYSSYCCLTFGRQSFAMSFATRASPTYATPATITAAPPIFSAAPAAVVAAPSAVVAPTPALSYSSTPVAASSNFLQTGSSPMCKVCRQQCVDVDILGSSSECQSQIVVMMSFGHPY